MLYLSLFVSKSHKGDFKMKNMKRVISTLLMLSMMAALLCVPAFADVTDVTGVFITSPSNSGSYNIPIDHTGNIRFDAYITSSTDDLSGKSVVWNLNGVNFTSTTNENGTCYAEYPLHEFREGPNTLTASINGHTAICDVTKPVPDLGAQDDIRFESNEITVTYGDTTKSVRVSVNGSYDNSLVKFFVEDPSVVSVNDYGDITTEGLGTTYVHASRRNSNSGVEAVCKIQVVSSVPDPDNVPTTVIIKPIPSTLQKGQTVDLYASVSGSSQKATFDRWVLDSRDAAYVSLGYDQAQSTTLTARAATSSPVTLYAYAKDGTNTSVQFTIAANENLQLAVSDENIYYDYAGKAKTSVISVANAFVGEEFTWSIVPSAQYGVLAGSNNYGSSVEVTAGPLEGRVNVTATSKADATRTATATIYVNVESEYGGASITPAVATWQRGQAALKFTVSPNYYYAYLDNKPLTPESRSYTYYNGVLTLSTGLLSGLSSGEHVLKVYTSSGNGQDGLVYATIYITGSASNVYGDNAHVRGSAYNLYFTSTDPIKEVYISNQWIDPANYTLTNNGTGLTLKSDFLNKLGYGSYSMRLVTQNGYNQNASFRIVTANYAPATGDDANMGAWMALLIMSLAGAVALIPRRKKSTDLIG